MYITYNFFVASSAQGHVNRRNGLRTLTVVPTSREKKGVAFFLPIAGGKADYGAPLSFVLHADYYDCQYPSGNGAPWPDDAPNTERGSHETNE